MLLTLMLFDVALAAPQLHPVILVHGYEGTRLLYTVDRSVPNSPVLCPDKPANETLWLNILNYVGPVSNGCWIQATSLVYDNFTRRSSSPPGVTVTTTDFGQLDGSEWLVPPPLRIYDTSYFYFMVEGLVGLGYRRNVNIRSAPYDWRKAPNENLQWFGNFRRLIEQTYYENNNSSVIILIHSMGSQFTYIFFEHMPSWWKDRYIRSWILIAPSLGGTFKYVYYYFGQGSYPSSLFPANNIPVRTFSSTAFLLPRAAAFGNEVLIRSSDGEYRSEIDYKRFFDQLNLPDAYNQWLDVSRLYDASRLTAPGNFSIYCLIGTGKQTLERAVFNGPVSQLTSYEAVFGDGDAFVNSKSARICYKFGEQGKRNFARREFPNTDHLEMIRNEEPIRYVMDIVTSINYDVEKFDD